VPDREEAFALLPNSPPVRIVNRHHYPTADIGAHWLLMYKKTP
jgi:hypothetical protein